MKLTLKEKIQKRGRIFKKAENLVKKAKREKRGMTDNENTTFDRMNEAVDRLTRSIETETRLLEMKNKIKVDSPSSGEEIQDKRGGKPQTKEEQRQAAFNTFLQHGENALNREQRSLLADSEKQGGYITAPQHFVNELITELDESVFVRNYATIHRINSGDSIGAPALEEDFEDADWTSEIKTGKETDLKFSKRELKTNPLNKRVKVSQKLLRNSAINVETLIRNRLRYRFQVTEEKAFMIGNGNKQPLGLFKTSKDGISANRDITGKLTIKPLLTFKQRLI